MVTRLFPIAASTHKRLIVYEGFYHELFNEVEKERVFQDLVNWLQADSGEQAIDPTSSQTD